MNFSNSDRYEFQSRVRVKVEEASTPGYGRRYPMAADLSEARKDRPPSGNVDAAMCAKDAASS